VHPSQGTFSEPAPSRVRQGGATARGGEAGQRGKAEASRGYAAGTSFAALPDILELRIPRHPRLPCDHQPLILSPARRESAAADRSRKTKRAARLQSGLLRGFVVASASLEAPSQGPDSPGLVVGSADVLHSKGVHRIIRVQCVERRRLTCAAGSVMAG
jgi:hypothetical protein